MKSREELLAKEQTLLSELNEVQRFLSEDKEAIKEFLFQIDNEELKDIVANKIKRMRTYDGFTDIRKGEMSYTAFVFETLEGEFYKILKGHNWHSSMLRLGQITNYNDDWTYELEDVERKWYALRESGPVDQIIKELLKSDNTLGLIVGLACFEY